jgi:hypothetical protein
MGVSTRIRTGLVWWSAALAAGCAPAVQSTLPRPPSAAELAELWIEPEPGRHLFHGVGGTSLAPDASARYRVIEVKTDGYSAGYTVLDADDSEWKVKFYPEAQTEVVASRILWALGYHQPPVYLLDAWTAEKADRPNPQTAARFRQETPPFHGLTEAGHWSYRENPFVGSTPLMGLLVLHVMLGNSDLKDENNMLYVLDEEVEGARRWFVARDLGHTFGRTGIVNAPRDHADAFDETPFILGVNDGLVRFDYRGRHRALFDGITVEHVRWIAERLHRLTDAQWDEAFRAGGYAKPIYERYLRRLKQKIEEGRSVEGRT